MEREEEIRESEERQKLALKHQIVMEAERSRDEPVDDSKLVDKMFEFLPPDSASESQVPPVSRKSRWEVSLICVTFDFYMSYFFTKLKFLKFDYLKERSLLLFI